MDLPQEFVIQALWREGQTSQFKGQIKKGDGAHTGMKLHLLSDADLPGWRAGGDFVCQGTLVSRRSPARLRQSVLERKAGISLASTRPTPAELSSC